MNPRTRLIICSLVVLFWSAVLLYFYASGRINKYLATDFRPFVLAGGLGLAVLGLFNVLTSRYGVGCGHDHGGGDADHDHDHAEANPVAAFLLMVVPVALSVAWTKDSYSLAALSRKGLYDSPSGLSSPFSADLQPMTREELEESHRKTADGFFEFNLMELFFATGDRDFQPLIEGLQVETEGRWTDEKGGQSDATRKRLYRLFLTCCAADSRALPIILEFDGPPPEFPDNAWVKVTGTMRFPLEDGVVLPVLFVEGARAADPPAEENFMPN